MKAYEWRDRYGRTLADLMVDRYEEAIAAQPGRMRLTCDRCKRDDDRPHYHAFVEVKAAEGKKRATYRHQWVCGDCKRPTDTEQEHRDDG